MLAVLLYSTLINYSRLLSKWLRGFYLCCSIAKVQLTPRVTRSTRSAAAERLIQFSPFSFFLFVKNPITSRLRCAAVWISDVFFSRSSYPPLSRSAADIAQRNGVSFRGKLLQLLIAEIRHVWPRPDHGSGVIVGETVASISWPAHLRLTAVFGDGVPDIEKYE